VRLDFCAACGSRDDLQHHHLVTRAEGGSNAETNLITLCCGCHLKLHERQRNGTYSHSQRTKAALAAAKARGKRLGRPAGSIVPNRDECSRRGGVAMAAKADGFAADLAPVLDELAGLSANAAAAELARRGYPTPRGGQWSAGKVINVRARLGR
jgi:hypothetical protein